MAGDRRRSINACRSAWRTIQTWGLSGRAPKRRLLWSARWLTEPKRHYRSLAGHRTGSTEPSGSHAGHPKCVTGRVQEAYFRKTSIAAGFGKDDGWRRPVIESKRYRDRAVSQLPFLLEYPGFAPAGSVNCYGRGRVMTMLADIPEADSIAAEFSVSAAIHASDFMYHYHLGPDSKQEMRAQATHYYFSDGARSAAHLDELIAHLHPDHSMRTLRLLEFASGYGMVSRHLNRMKERYALTACDIHEQAIEFLQTAIEVDAVLSRTDPDDLSLPQSFDVVFALSFFSHVPDGTWGRWLRKLYSTLANDGLLIFTTHGRGAHDRAGRPHFLPEGCWYAAASEQADLRPEDYGTTLVEPFYVFQQIERCADASMVLFEEGSWWADQDTYVVRKAPGSFRRRLRPRCEESAANQRITDLVAENRALRDSIDVIHASRSWRVTSPMRMLSRLVKGRT